MNGDDSVVNVVYIVAVFLPLKQNKKNNDYIAK